jgi:hypothetical protein
VWEDGIAVGIANVPLVVLEEAIVDVFGMDMDSTSVNAE